MDGILAIWKEAGMTSHDVVFKARQILGTKKIGHTGTLDPGVEGVLVLCVGQATKLVEFLQDGRKVYQGEVTLGWSTSTEDSEGEIIERQRLDQPISEEAIDQAVTAFLGPITQVPPYYSAVKVKGKRLYEYARAGIEVERPKRQVEIYDFKRIGPVNFDPEQGSESFPFEVTCSKGTYVRTLAVDLGAQLGLPAHMSRLERLETGGFGIADSVRLDQLQALVDQGQLDQVLQPMEASLSEFTTYSVEPDLYQAVKFGKVLPIVAFGDCFKEGEVDLLALVYQGKFIGLYQPHPSKPGYVKPRKMFIP
ncbi:tRNA pseudouridine(55) synthase TruB [Hutsoniella sourekii]